MDRIRKRRAGWQRFANGQETLPEWSGRDARLSGKDPAESSHPWRPRASRGQMSSPCICRAAARPRSREMAENTASKAAKVAPFSRRPAGDREKAM